MSMNIGMTHNADRKTVRRVVRPACRAHLAVMRLGRLAGTARGADIASARRHERVPVERGASAGEDRLSERLGGAGARDPGAHVAVSMKRRPRERRRPGERSASFHGQRR